jgi:hypothetical protein
MPAWLPLVVDSLVERQDRIPERPERAQLGATVVARLELVE